MTILSGSVVETGTAAAPADRTQAAQRRRGTGLRAGGLVLALAVLVLMAGLSLAFGAKHLPLGTVWDALHRDDGGQAAYIVREVRLPRVILGALTGMALGLSGAIMQAMTRNPLADPGLFGIEIGASAGVVIAIALLGITAPVAFVWFALAGSAVAATLVYSLGSAGRYPSPDRMVLAGAGVGAALAAFVTTVLLLDGQAFDRYRFWVIGSLAGRGLNLVWQLGPFILAAAVVALGLGRGLNALALGQDTGQVLGVNVTAVRVASAVTVIVLAGTSTAIAGPIGFVGLAVPHVARLLVGQDNRWVLPYSAVLAAILLIATDLIGRLIIAPSELEVGLVMSFVGAPVFIALCRRRRMGRL
ncbi:iron ABC transporter permease [Frankia sp. AgPm24]|uniref:FecCD family ABC transporter permease n=1 Tax=Frankia sp. AgPm24 TaxID=631128 RepID=UPI00200CF99E|nr:iron ABC transporter permease [Frankia sp. AgPm24]MCK9923694.1 iron ABC transporter permease [Frankia sp. AgPm24]